MSRGIKFLIIFIISITVSIFFAPFRVQAQENIVHSILFYSPSCGHCHKVITEDLPPLINKYQEQLIIVGIDVSNPQGQQLYQLAIDHFNIPDNRLGVPMLIVGDQVLVGSLEIPEKFPGIIEQGLASGGIYWPEIPEIKQLLEQEFQAEEETAITPTAEVSLSSQVVGDPGNQANNLNSTPAENNSDQINSLLEKQESQSLLIQRFRADLYGNFVSVLILIGMLSAVIYVGYVYVTGKKKTKFLLPEWTIPILAITGLIVAIYLTYVETSQVEAVCGPIGDCNTVQQSQYAYLFGVVPIGLIGIIGYILIFAAWLTKSITNNNKLKYFLSLAIWLMTWFGVLFSIYLTFLEPFVIGATCMWCITSAILMTLMLLASTTSITQLFTNESDDIGLVEIQDNPEDIQI